MGKGRYGSAGLAAAVLVLLVIVLAFAYHDMKAKSPNGGAARAGAARGGRANGATPGVAPGPGGSGPQGSARGGTAARGAAYSDIPPRWVVSPPDTARPRQDVVADGMFIAPGGGNAPDAPERRSVYAALNRLYSTADADPIITGNLYAWSDGVRNVYAERTSHGDVHGLTEYSSSGGPGDVGVDVGPYGLAEYGGKQIGYDDGIPEDYALPSTPVRWYGPRQRDYYGVEGPTVYAEGLYTISEPDHDPLMN